jgi:hypothetical protein
MAKQIVMDTSGDTRHEFDPADTAAVAEALARFQGIDRRWLPAAVRTGPGTSELVRDFDPAADEVLVLVLLMLVPAAANGERDVAPAPARWIVLLGEMLLWGTGHVGHSDQAVGFAMPSEPCAAASNGTNIRAAKPTTVPSFSSPSVGNAPKKAAPSAQTSPV